MVKEAAEKNGWKWIITRPNFIIGTSKVFLFDCWISLSLPSHAVAQGNYMSLAVTIALYAIARKALDQPLVFPGSSISYNQEYDHSLADNNAAFQLYSAQHQTAGNRIYNIHDGKPVKFSQLWPKVAK